MNKDDYDKKVLDKLKKNIKNKLIKVSNKTKIEILEEIDNNCNILIKPMHTIYCIINKLQHCIPTIYALIKTHKIDRPVRIITNTLDAPGRDLAIYIKNKLTEMFPVGKYNNTNTTDLIKKLKDFNATNDTKMCVIDIIDMYSNINIYEVISIIEEKLIENQQRNMRRVIITALNFLLYKIPFFIHSNKIYKQCNGLPMGGLLSAILARIYIDFKLTHNFKRDKKDTIINIYVDDILIITNNNDGDAITKEIKDAIQLDVTRKDELENTIQYLDIEIVKIDQQLKTRLFKKSITSDRMINYHSSHTAQQKKASIKQFIWKIINYTDCTFLPDCIKKCNNILYSNNYPKNYIQNIYSELVGKILDNHKKEIISAANNIKIIDKITVTFPTHKKMENTTTGGVQDTYRKNSVQKHIIQHSYNKKFNHIIMNTFKHQNTLRNFILTNKLKRNALFEMRKEKKDLNLIRGVIIRNDCTSLLAISQKFSLLVI